MKVLVMQLASTTIMDLVAYGGAGLGIAMSIISVINWGLSPVAALFLILVAADFFLPLRAFGSAFHIAMNGASAGKKILSLLEQPDPVWGEETVEDTELKVDNVTFSYDGKRDVLKNITMTFPKSRYDLYRGRKWLWKIHRGQHAVRGVQTSIGCGNGWRYPVFHLWSEEI